MANHLPGKVLKITIEWRDEGVLLKKYDVVMEQATAKELYLEAASKARMPVAGPNRHVLSLRQAWRAGS